MSVRCLTWFAAILALAPPLAGQTDALRDADPAAINHPDERAAFWIIAYNISIFEGLRRKSPEERTAISNGGFAVLRS